MSLAEDYAVRDLDTLSHAILHCQQRNVVVQAGGLYGTWAKHLSAYFQTVYVFEPDAANFDILARNLAGCSHIIKIQAALGNRRMPLMMGKGRRDGSSKPTHDGLKHIVPHEGAVPVFRVDDLGLRELDLLCLDLEGFELPAIFGSEETIRRCRPVILCEVNQHCKHYGFEPEDLRTALRIRGYDQVGRFRSDEIYIPKR